MLICATWMGQKAPEGGGRGKEAGTEASFPAARLLAESGKSGLGGSDAPGVFFPLRASAALHS